MSYQDLFFLQILLEVLANESQENLPCKHFQPDILSEERKDLGKSRVRIFGSSFTTTRRASCVQHCNE